MPASKDQVVRSNLGIVPDEYVYLVHEKLFDCQVVMQIPYSELPISMKPAAKYQELSYMVYAKFNVSVTYYNLALLKSSR